jgi:hypothetical protein
MKVVSLLSLALIVGAHCAVLDETFAWRELEFSWPSEDVRQEAIRSGNYVSANNLPLAFDVWRDRVFLTVPRCE